MSLTNEIVIEELTPKERLLHTRHVIGKTTCPHCNRSDVKVVNFDSGNEPKKCFLESHRIGKGTEMCPGSDDWSYEIPKR